MARNKHQSSNLKSFIIIFLILLVLILLSIISYNFSLGYFKTASNEFLVTEVLDGDTFIIETGEYVRLIGVDAPEKEHAFYNKSKDFLALLILNKTIMLEKDLDNRDNFGRLLRYAYINNLSVNLELIRQGYAIPMFISPNLRHKEEIENAYKECIKTRINLCMH